MSSSDLCADLKATSREAEIVVHALWVTYCHISTSVIVKIPQPQSMFLIVFVTVTVTQFVTS
jgi:hypothetical protein